MGGAEGVLPRTSPPARGPQSRVVPGRRLERCQLPRAPPSALAGLQSCAWRPEPCHGDGPAFLWVTRLCRNWSSSPMTADEGEGPQSPPRWPGNGGARRCWHGALASGSGKACLLPAPAASRGAAMADWASDGAAPCCGCSQCAATTPPEDTSPTKNLHQVRSPLPTARLSGSGRLPGAASAGGGWRRWRGSADPAGPAGRAPVEMAPPSPQRRSPAPP